MDLRLGAIGGLAWFSACAPAPLTSHASHPKAGSDVAEPSTLSDDVAASSSAESSSVDSQTESVAPADAAPSFDLDAWAREHGVVVELSVDGCELARLGDKPDQTLWCFRHEEQPGARVLYFRALYVLAAHRLARVTELPSAAGPFASEGQSAAPRTVELVAKVASDAQSVVLEEAPGHTCDDARSANDKALVDEPLGGPGFIQLVNRVCAARGRYRWHAGTLSKER